MSKVIDLSKYSADCPLTYIESSLAEAAVAKLYNAGVIEGYFNGKFNQKESISKS